MPRARHPSPDGARGRRLPDGPRAALALLLATLLWLVVHTRLGDRAAAPAAPRGAGADAVVPEARP
jgi:hypothetical protein